MPINPEFNRFNSFKNKEELKTSLVFPYDLQTEEYYPEAIKFTVIERSGLTLEILENALKKSANVNNTLNSVEETDRAIVDNEAEIDRLSESVNGPGRKPAQERIEEIAARRQVSKLLKEQRKRQNITVGEFAVKAIKDFQQNIGNALKLQEESKRIIQSIYLQMPESVVYNEQVDWTGTDLGVVGAFTQGGSVAGVKSGLLGAAGTILGGATASLVGKLPGLGNSIATGILGGLLTGGPLQGAIESSFNVKTNPYKEQTFQGMPFRPFEFSFVFRARNQEEVNEVRNIITSFRGHSKPILREDNLFDYPYEFLIEFLTLKKGEYTENSYLPKIKTCICKSVNTNFTTTGWKSFRDGAPVDITLTLSFEETELLTQSDVLIDQKNLTQTGTGGF